MLKDIHFRFIGFHGSRGRCHIRLIRAARDKPMVIVCSQYMSYYGTSVTNAVEIIAEKLFYDIVNERIEGEKINFPFSIYRHWHSDANFFDKFLSFLFPSKYRTRFSSLKINIVESFSKIIWVENYPEKFSVYSNRKHISIVEMGRDGYPRWLDINSDCFLKKTGLTLTEALPDDDVLDLNKIEIKMDYSKEDFDELGNLHGYSISRWTKKIVEQLPERLSAFRHEHSISGADDINELSIHDQISKFFCVELPVSELFEREFRFSKILDANHKGKEKAADFVLYKPNREIDSVLEVKRTSCSNNNLEYEIKKDLARLLLLSERLNCYCYFLLYGNVDILEGISSKLDEYLSFNDDSSFITREFLINQNDFKSKYGDLLYANGIKSGGSMLQGKNFIKKNGVYLWQIAVYSDMLIQHRGYEFILKKYK